MMKYMSFAAAAGILAGASVISAQAAEGSERGSAIRYVQLNSPGDGLDPSAAAQGNGRPSRRAAPPRRKAGKRMR